MPYIDEDARFELQGRFSGQTYNYSIDNVSVKEFTYSHIPSK